MDAYVGIPAVAMRSFHLKRTVQRHHQNFISPPNPLPDLRTRLGKCFSAFGGWCYFPFALAITFQLFYDPRTCFHRSAMFHSISIPFHSIPFLPSRYSFCDKYFNALSISRHYQEISTKGYIVAMMAGSSALATFFCSRPKQP